MNLCINFLYSVDFIIISYHTLTTLLPHFFPISSSLKHSETTYFRKRKKPQNPVNTRFSRLFHKQGMRESNSRQRFWRPLSYHLTNPLCSLCFTCRKAHVLLYSLGRFCQVKNDINNTFTDAFNLI